MAAVTESTTCWISLPSHPAIMHRGREAKAAPAPCTEHSRPLSEVSLRLCPHLSPCGFGIFAKGSGKSPRTPPGSRSQALSCPGGWRLMTTVPCSSLRAINMDSIFPGLRDSADRGRVPAWHCMHHCTRSDRTRSDRTRAASAAPLRLLCEKSPLLQFKQTASPCRVGQQGLPLGCSPGRLMEAIERMFTV